jgi:hypothetical protein
MNLHMLSLEWLKWIAEDDARKWEGFSILNGR